MTLNLHDFVADYLESCGQPGDAIALHEEIDNPAKRSWNYECLKEYAEDMTREEYAKDDWTAEQLRLKNAGLDH